MTLKRDLSTSKLMGSPRVVLGSSMSVGAGAPRARGRRATRAVMAMVNFMILIVVLWMVWGF